MGEYGAHQASSGGSLSKYLLRLFVTGASSRTGTAIANLRRICEQELEGQYELEIIDVLEFPDLAEDEKILATPTLIKSLPLPLRRVIGGRHEDPRAHQLEQQTRRCRSPELHQRRIDDVGGTRELGGHEVVGFGRE